MRLFNGIMAVFICILASLFFIGCTEPEVVDFSFDLSNLEDEVNVKTFNLNDIKLRLKFNGSKDVLIDLSEEMISIEDLNKFKQTGIHQIAVTYRGITNILEIKMVTDMYTITFLDFNDNVISKQLIEEGKDAVVPNYNDILGYEFVGLDSKDYLNVTKDAVIKPIYQRNIFNVCFIVDEKVVFDCKCKKGETISEFPEVPYKEGYVGRWSIDNDFIITEDLEVKPIYEVDEDYQKVQEIKTQLLEKYSNQAVESNLTFEENIEGFNLIWETNSEFLSNKGELSRPYHETVIFVTVKLTKNDKEREIEIPMTLKGFKDLSNSIASGYIYRDYNKLSDKVFETLDIIYCAFIRFDKNGEFLYNATVLRNIQDYVLPKAKEQGIYTLFSLGGGGTAAKEAFESVTADPLKRKILINSLIGLINQYGFDGIDIDWETPTNEESVYFTAFVKELNEAVKKNNPNHLVTAAIAGGMWQPKKYDLPNSEKYLDYINVMTYGMITNSAYYQNALYPRDGFHDTVNKIGEATTSCSIHETVKIYNDLGVANNKLIFGLAFYGVSQKKQDGKWVKGSSIFYTSIKKDYLNNDSYDYYFDEVCQVPYITNKEKTFFISYDDPRSVIAKCNYVKETKCAGVMYWENGCDLTDDLIQAIYDGLKSQTNE